MTKTLREDRLYLGDNGRCFCGSLRCAGMTAYFSGRDLSGQAVEHVTAAMVRDAGMDVGTFKCESCGKGLHLVTVR